MSNKLNLANAEFVDGEWWYMLHGKPRQRLSTHNKRNKGRMYVAEAKPEYKDGYIPKGTRKDRDPHPFVLLGYHTPGYFKTWAEVVAKMNKNAKIIVGEFTQESKRVKSSEGYVYVVTTPCFEGWVKIGIVETGYEDRRIGQFHTSTPYRNHEYAYMKKFSDRHVAESIAHVEAQKVHIGHDKKQNGEWFKMSVEQAIDIINRIEE